MVQKKTSKIVKVVAKVKETVAPVVASVAVKPVEKKKKSRKKMLVIIALVFFVLVVWYYVGIYGIKMMDENGYLSKKGAGELTDTAVVAMVDGQNITLGEVREFARGIPQLSDLPFNMIYPQILNNIISTRVMMAGAEKSGVENDLDVIKALKVSKDQILSQAFLAQQLKDEMTEEVMQDLYKSEMRNFERPDEVSARHILVKSKEDADDIIVQLKAGVDFAMLANKKSLDQDNKGGSLGYFTKNMMIPEFGNAVFAMKKGQLSAPIKTPFGWHVVLVEDKRLAAPPVFEEVQDQLKQLYAERNVKRVIEQEWQKAKATILIPKMN